jgi:AraC family transcriptional regulator
MADTFAQFLEWLARHMDDHDTRGSELAAELYVSRSVLDRIVAAAAGETTARFRRRLLLERAAYRLRSTDTGVLEAAVEAGYSSSEAFSRAFSRAYGLSPTAWRCSGTGLRIASRSGVHFYPPGGLRLPARKEATVNFTANLFDHHVATLGELLDRAGTLTDRQLDAPIELSVPGIDDHPSIRSLLSRLVGQLDMWQAAMASQPYDFGIERAETIEAMRARLDRVGPLFATYVRDVTCTGRLDETFVDATGDQPYVFTAAGMIAHVITYAAYRRTLAASAIESASGSALSDDPLAWFRP